MEVGRIAAERDDSGDLSAAGGCTGCSRVVTRCARR